MKSTAHIDPQAPIAPTVLMPGDPLRAKFIAENYLEDAEQFNSVRNMLGFTGTYQGTPVSVMGSGMGIPSISLYAWELIHVFDCKRLIRVGTCGGMHEKVKLRDVFIAQGATTDSGIIRSIFGGSINYAPLADYELLSAAVENAKKLNLPVRVGNVISVDRFYDEEIDNAKLRQYGVLAVEMEAAALYLIAAKFGVRALALFTVSDHLVSDEPPSTAEERQTSFSEMIEIALEASIA